MRFTELALKKIPHSDQRRLFDDALPGFGITVGKRTKTFFVMFGQNRRLKTLGRFPQKSLSDARKEAKRHLARDSEESLPQSISEALETYLDDCTSRLRPNTLRVYRHFLKTDYRGKLADIRRSHLNLTDPHAINAWKVFFNWCIRNDILDRNPLAGERVSYNQRERVLTDEELRLVWAYEDTPFTTILKLLILTGQRRTEIGSLQWSWILNDVIVFPSRITKNKKTHSLPIGPRARQLLQGIEEDGAFVFKGRGKAPFSGWSKSKARMDKELLFPHWTIHDLRRTFATTHARLGTPIHITEALLNHVSGTRSGIIGLYQRHDYKKEMKGAALNYEREISRLVGP